MIKIGIIGNGFVGKATTSLQCKDINVMAYDLNPKLCIPEGAKLEDLMSCDIIFISVPTPMKNTGECYLGYVEGVIQNLKELKYNKNIVLRSTVPVGTCDKLNCYFMPEFLTEKNYILDFKNNKDWIFGLKENDNNEKKFKSIIEKLFTLAKENDKIKHNSITFLSNKEAELVKMFKNCFLATKVSFCNEIYQFCQLKNVNYENVRKLAANDDRIQHSHTKVPGPDGKLGFGGTCFPKDISSLKYEMENAGMTPHILKSVITRNETQDRTKKDWEDNKGRAVID